MRETDEPRQILRYTVQVAEEQGIGKRYLSNFHCFHYAYAKAANSGMITTDRSLKSTDFVTSP